MVAFKVPFHTFSIIIALLVTGSVFRDQTTEAAVIEKKGPGVAEVVRQFESGSTNVADSGSKHLFPVKIPDITKNVSCIRDEYLKNANDSTDGENKGPNTVAKGTHKQNTSAIRNRLALFEDPKNRGSKNPNGPAKLSDAAPLISDSKTPDSEAPKEESTNFEGVDDPKDSKKPADTMLVVSDEIEETGEEKPVAKVCDAIDLYNPPRAKRGYAIHCKKKIEGKTSSREAAYLEFYRDVFHYGRCCGISQPEINGYQIRNSVSSSRSLYIRIFLEKQFENESTEMKRELLTYFKETILEREEYKYGKRSMIGSRYVNIVQVNYVAVYQSFVGGDEKLYEEFDFVKQKDGTMLLHLENESVRRF